MASAESPLLVHNSLRQNVCFRLRTIVAMINLNKKLLAVPLLYVSIAFALLAIIFTIIAIANPSWREGNLDGNHLELGLVRAVIDHSYEDYILNFRDTVCMTGPRTPVCVHWKKFSRAGITLTVLSVFAIFFCAMGIAGSLFAFSMKEGFFAGNLGHSFSFSMVLGGFIFYSVDTGFASLDHNWPWNIALTSIFFYFAALVTHATGSYLQQFYRAPPKTEARRVGLEAMTLTRTVKDTHNHEEVLPSRLELADEVVG
eukprot:GILJ01011646.1.p1 GENE.GILJ01011646.1~~GILJ01011646.1.p1  ORF type:complete len:257 (-),score=22.29 GILJ01011646.1:396-1166(-)